MQGHGSAASNRPKNQQTGRSEARTKQPSGKPRAHWTNPCVASVFLYGHYIIGPKQSILNVTISKPPIKGSPFAPMIQ